MAFLALELVALAQYFLLPVFSADGALGLTFLLHTAVMFGGVALVVSWWRGWSRQALRAGTFMWLGACMFTCLCLNVSEPVFAPFAPWVNGVIGLLALSTIAWAWEAQLPRVLRAFLWCSLALSGWLCLYLAVYLAPMAPVAIFALLFLGLGFYLLVPLFFCISIGIKLCRAWRENRRAIGVGLSLPLLILLLVSLQAWRVKAQIREAMAPGGSDLPVWVRLAQHISPSQAAWYGLGRDLFYESRESGGFFNGRPANRYARQVVHDPLFTLTSGVLFSGWNALVGPEDRLRALQTIFKNDHLGEQRLWSGQDLFTTRQRTRVHIDPAYRLARTEQELEVGNTSQWGQQEAIYTFYLPEGSTVTGLSLWVNGVEEKGHLTTRARASTAYNTVVGTERRDPSVIHWKEGNTVSVRVFPCTAREQRRFKLVFVSPLRLEGAKLVYESAVFDGPPAPLRAQEVQLSGLPQGEILQLPRGLARRKGTREFAGRLAANQQWRLCLKAGSLPEGPVQIGETRYRLTPLAYSEMPFSPKALFLDLNANWTASDRRAVLAAAGALPCYAWTGSGWAALGDPELRCPEPQNFSLFPFHRLVNPDQALVVSKGGRLSPRLSDLRGSAFAEGMQAFCRNNGPVRLFVLGTEHSTYLKGLQELGEVQTVFGTPERLAQLLKKQVFPVPDLGAHDLLLLSSGVMLKVAGPSGNAGAPASEALVRLASYHRLMRRLGPDYFLLDQEEVQERWLEAARSAGVLSPMSSLVVLESQADYQRFNVDGPGEQVDDPLPKLAQSQSGAVPEPSEWALLALGLLFMLFLWWKKW